MRATRWPRLGTGLYVSNLWYLNYLTGWPAA